MIFINALFLLMSPQTTWSYETLVEAHSFSSTTKVIIDQETIKKTKAPNLSSLLSTQANIQVSSTPFQPNTLYLRGGDSSHILILVDGLPFYDASTIRKNVNINSIDIKAVKRVEIIKGSQSVLYGGQALAGVIKIETIAADSDNKYSVSSHLGQYHLQKLALEIEKPLLEDSQIAVRGQITKKDSLSPVLNSDQKYANSFHSTELVYLRQKSWRQFFKVFHGQQKDELATSNSQLVAVDTTGLYYNNSFQGAQAGLKHTQSPHQTQILLGYQNNYRSFDQVSSSTDEKYRSEATHLRSESIFLNNDNHLLKAGFSFSSEKFHHRSAGVEKSLATGEIAGLFVKYDYKSLELGLRTDRSPGSSNVETFQVGYSLGKNIKFEYASGFKPPSLFQKYSLSYGGNPSLAAERSSSYSVSFNYEITSHHAIMATLFQTDFSNLIQFVGIPPSGGYVNVASAQAKGLELGYALRHQRHFGLDVYFSYQEPRDLSNGRWLLLRPMHSGGVRLNIGHEKLRGGIESSWVGERLDKFSSTSFGTIPSYWTTNLFTTWQMSSITSSFLRIQNLQGTRFEVARGNYDEGRIWIAGVEAQF